MSAEHDALVAWAAGLFEGEGSIYLDRSRHRRGNGRLQLRLKLASTDQDVVERFASVVGCGSTVGPYWQPLSTKPIWVWHVSNQDAAALAELLRPHLGFRRREQLDAALEEKRTTDAAYVPKPLGAPRRASAGPGQMGLDW